MARLSPRSLLAAAVLATCLLDLAAGGTVLLKTRTRGKIRLTRGIIKRLLCRRFGTCNSAYGGSFGGYPGGGYQGGYQGNPGAFQGYSQIPAISIGISQSQSSSSGSTGGYSSSTYPNNYQYNVGHPAAGGHSSAGPHGQRPYPGYSTPYSPYNLGGYGGYIKRGYAGFNHGGFTGFGGPYDNGYYGIHHPHGYGDEVTEESGPIHQNIHEYEGGNNNPGGSQFGAKAITPSGSFAYARVADRYKAPQAPK